MTMINGDAINYRARVSIIGHQYLLILQLLSGWRFLVCRRLPVQNYNSRPLYMKPAGLITLYPLEPSRCYVRILRANFD